MTASSDIIVVHCSAPDEATAKQLAHDLVEQQLAACVQILPGMLSVYSWQDKICQENEVLLVIKTDNDHWAAVEAFIQAHHPYDEPELIALPSRWVTGGYAQWLKSSLQSNQ